MHREVSRACREMGRARGEAACRQFLMQTPAILGVGWGGVGQSTGSPARALAASGRRSPSSRLPITACFFRKSLHSFLLSPNASML